MRSPGGKPGYRPGRTFENELNLRYLSPGAFTVLSPEENGSPPDPPAAPPQFRISPNARRSKNQSFAIIAEPANYEPYRSPSPSAGRVSPFRGRGFNPTGSRHTSPEPSPAPPPPPEDTRLNYRPNCMVTGKRSHIPQMKRRYSSEMLSTEDSTDESSPKNQRRNSLIKPQLSKSLNNIDSRSNSKVVTGANASANARRSGVFARKPITTCLSPIIGSSPEPSSDTKSMSSPSRIPKSRSSPSSRKPSPSRDLVNAKAAKHHYKSTGNLMNARLRIAERKNRDTSPSQIGGKPPISPAKRNYRNVQAKVNSFNAKTRTKVPNNANSNSSSKSKPHEGEKQAAPRRASNAKLQRTESISSVNKTSLSSATASKRLPKLNGETESSSDKASSPEKKAIKRTPSTKNLNPIKEKSQESSETDSSSGAAVASAVPALADPIALRKIESAPKLVDMLPSATTVVATTTETVTKPLRIEATLDTPVKSLAGGGGAEGGLTAAAMKPIKETPMYMDEDSQALRNDHNLAKLTPTTSSVVTLANDAPTNTLPQVENIPTTLAVPGGGISTMQSVNHNGGLIPINIKIGPASGGVNGDMSSANNVQLISSDDGLDQYKHSDMHVPAIITQPSTKLLHEVKPIKILVQEKGDNMDVQTANVRFPPNATNGTAQGAGASPPATEEEISSNQPIQNKCRVFMHKFKDKMRCACKRSKVDETMPQIEIVHDDADQELKGCFACLKKKEKLHDVEEIIITSTDEVETAKKTFFDRIKCCRGNKVADSTTGCFGLRANKKKQCADRRDSILSVPVPLTVKDRCKNFFRKLFCCGCRHCRRPAPPPPPLPIDDAASRRASLLSKKKSLTPTVLPQEDPRFKLDNSLVDYTSTMKAAIPVLPLALAYICLFLNIFLPGSGTVFSGIFCLCLGKPRFSQHDGPKPRLGSFIINSIIGAGQLFTVLFCLVGWGWSIWWGVIMIKIAKKYRKIKTLEERAAIKQKEAPHSKEGSQKRDIEKGRS